jgi:hypothetical protein
MKDTKFKYAGYNKLVLTGRFYSTTIFIEA